jgi:hypothetical protein
VVVAIGQISHGVLSGSSALRRWSITTGIRLAPSFTVPLSGSSSPISILRSVVLPAPLGPIRPMRSVRKMRIEKSRTIALSPKLLEMPRAVMASAPDCSAWPASMVARPVGPICGGAACAVRRARAGRPSLRVRRARNALARPFGLALDQPVELVPLGRLALEDVGRPGLERS